MTETDQGPVPADDYAADDYDSPWKDVLEHAFPEFMAFYFPEAHAQIDWSQGHEFKNTELRQVVRDAGLGRRYADALVRITLVTGEERWIYIHIEVQGQRDAGFAQRMFTYNYRLYDRFARPVASLAVLADDDEGWKPDSFGFEVLGCRHRLEFPVVKLIEFADRLDHLETDPNPFALVTAAHLRTRQTRKDPEARYQAKRGLVRLLYRRGWDRQRGAARTLGRAHSRRPDPGSRARRPLTAAPAPPAGYLGMLRFLRRVRARRPGNAGGGAGIVTLCYEDRLWWPG